MNLQAELAYIQARLSTMQSMPSVEAQAPPAQSISTSEMASNSIVSMHFDILQEVSTEFTSLCNPLDNKDDDLQALARDFVSRYLPGVRFRPPTSQ